MAIIEYNSSLPSTFTSKYTTNLHGASLKPGEGNTLTIDRNCSYNKTKDPEALRKLIIFERRWPNPSNDIGLTFELVNNELLIAFRWDTFFFLKSSNTQ
jgi:hypothetical protein